MVDDSGVGELWGGCARGDAVFVDGARGWRGVRVRVADEREYF